MRDEEPRVLDRLRYADAVAQRPAGCSRPPPEVIEARLREHERRIRARCSLCGISRRGTVSCRKSLMWHAGLRCPLERS